MEPPLHGDLVVANVASAGRSSYSQGLEFALLLKIDLFKERRWANRFSRSLQMSNRERITLVALYKRVTWVNCSHCSLKSQCEWSAQDSLFHSQKTSYSLWKNSCFYHVFDSFQLFSLFYAQERISPVSLCSVAPFLKSGGSDLLSSLFKKELPWANHSHHS